MEGGEAGAISDPNLLSLVFSSVTPRDLVRAQGVCRGWGSIARDPKVRRAAFVHHWRLKDCLGTPRQANFFEVASLGSFVLWHEVQRCDSLQMLAVRHQVDLVLIKRINNIMTDHSLYSRTHIFIPVSKASDLEGQVVVMQYCPLAARDVAVLAGRGGQLPHLNRNKAQGHGANAAASHLQIEQLRAKLTLLLGRSLHIDERTAKFYLEDNNGDLKAAITAFEQDIDWEGTTAGPLRTVPMQRWISGELGL